ncbi:MAG: ribosome maturation factor RimP [Acidaminococcaceae bacterium]|nr:ribosome maturation factor RimP [Acidaminococcaceae bacterium]HAY61111.1 ribosome maturation factor [Acidaminococcaceae bacterium]
MKREEVEQYIASVTEKILEGTDLTLVDVEYVRQKDWYLRVYIDKPGGIEIDDCQKVSEQLTEILDKEDPISEKYYLEVSSPGIDRPLKKDRDYVANYGKKVDLTFFEPWQGMKNVTGILDAHDADTLTIRKIAKGKTDAETSVIERKQIAAVKPHIDF